MRCGEFEVDLRLRELRRGSATIRLQDQPFQILELLLERSGDIVTREEIQRRLWPDGTSVDFQHSVNAAVRRLRSALGDDADEPRYVETLPRRGYRLVASLDGTGSTATTAAGRGARPRMVVLPFANLSGHADRDYFSDGLTEELIAQLGRRCGNRVGVLARTSSMVYKNVTQHAGDIGRALRADYLVEGSIRASGDRIRVTAQLVETAGETNLWVQSFDRVLDDGLALQEEVASVIAQALTDEIAPPSAETRYTHDHKAYEAYLTGRFHWNKPGVAGLSDAIAWYDQALLIDPAFGRAHSARARAYLSAADQYVAHSLQALRSARLAAERAIELDASDAEGWVVLAEVRRVLDWDGEGARAAYHRALALNPNSEVAHRYYAWFLGTHEPGPAARAVAERAIDLDPFCLSMLVYVASTLYFAGDFDAAVALTRRARAMAPDYQPAARIAAGTLVQLGRPDEAVAEFDRYADDELTPVSLAWKAEAMAATGAATQARALIGACEERWPEHVVSYYHLSRAYVALGETDDAIACLDRACHHRDPWLDALNVDPGFVALRGRGAFDNIVSRLAVGATR